METIFVFDSKTAVAANGGIDQDFEVQLRPAIQLHPNKQHEIALVEATLRNNWHNVTPANNKFAFETAKASDPSGQPAIKHTVIELNPGAYNIPDLNNAMQEALTKAEVVDKDAL